MGDKLSLPEAAEIAGITAGTMRMHVLRGKLPSSKPKGRLVIDSDDLDAYLVSENLKDVIADSAGKPARTIYRNLGRVLIAAPQHVRDAILRGGRKGT